MIPTDIDQFQKVNYLCFGCTKYFGFIWNRTYLIMDCVQSTLPKELYNLKNIKSLNCVINKKISTLENIKNYININRVNICMINKVNALDMPRYYHDLSFRDSYKNFTINVNNLDFNNYKKYYLSFNQ